MADHSDTKSKAFVRGRADRPFATTLSLHHNSVRDADVLIGLVIRLRCR